MWPSGGTGGPLSDPLSPRLLPGAGLCQQKPRPSHRDTPGLPWHPCGTRQPSSLLGVPTKCQSTELEVMLVVWGSWGEE